MKNHFCFLAVLIIISAALTLNAQVKEYFITCNPTDFDMIYKQWDKDIYIPITITFQNKTWTDVRMRIKGDGTRQLPKKSFKLQFDSELFINERETVNFNAEYEADYLTQYLATRVFQESGHVCYQTEHARLYINGKFWGLYLKVENIDDQFLEARGLDKKGNLYKASLDGSDMSLFDKGAEAWEKKTNENEDWSDLGQLIQELSNTPQEQYYDWAKAKFDYDKMINIIAVNLLIQNKSTWYHNYYMFNDRNKSGKWTMFPWDLDKTFQVAGIFWDYTFAGGAGYQHSNPFFKRALIDERIFFDVRSRVKMLAETIFNQEHLFPIVDSLVQVLMPSIVEDKSDNIVDSATWIKNVGNMKIAIKDRYAFLQNQFDKFPYTFAVERTPFTYFDRVTFNCRRSKDPNGDPITYQLRYNNKSKSLALADCIHIDNITDTTYTLEAKLDTGLYYWQIDAYDGKNYTEGWDITNTFRIAQPTVLPCEIEKDMTLTKDKSPYKIDCDVTVRAGVKLIIQGGVDLIIALDKNINVYGNLLVNGDSLLSVNFHPLIENQSWGKINYHTGSGGNINFLNIINGKVQIDTTNININHLKLSYKKGGGYSLMTLSNSVSVIENSTIVGSNDEGCIGILGFNGFINILNCEIYNCADALNFNGTTQSTIKGNYIHDNLSDCIDFDGCKNMTIEKNKIKICGDKGISLGFDNIESSKNVKVEENIIESCHKGVGLKDSSYAMIKNNTFYKNDTGIAVYEKYVGYGGARADIVNNIISQSNIYSVFIDKLSSANITYSLSDKDLLPGEGNIFADPLFMDATKGNFHLLPNSPCINAGDPNSQSDPDGTRADIGALYYNMTSENIVINEINYHSSADFDPDDWVEFYNPDVKPVSLAGWYFMDEDNSHKFNFPNISLPADDYLVLSKDTVIFKKQFTNVNKYIGNTGFGLDGNGELIRLYDFSGNLVDSVRYGDKAPWPTEPDGKDATLELLNPSLDNALGQNWRASAGYGTPGARNSVNVPVEDINVSGTDMLIFPNPASDELFIKLNAPDDIIMNATIYDVYGVEIAFRNPFNYNGITKLLINDFAHGIYILKVKAINKEYKTKFAVIK